MHTVYPKQDVENHAIPLHKQYTVGWIQTKMLTVENDHQKSPNCRQTPERSLLTFCYLRRDTLSGSNHHCGEFCSCCKDTELRPTTTTTKTTFDHHTKRTSEWELISHCKSSQPDTSLCSELLRSELVIRGK